MCEPKSVGWGDRLQIGCGRAHPDLHLLLGQQRTLSSHDAIILLSGVSLSIPLPPHLCPDVLHPPPPPLPSLHSVTSTASTSHSHLVATWDSDPSSSSSSSPPQDPLLLGHLPPSSSSYSRVRRWARVCSPQLLASTTPVPPMWACHSTAGVAWWPQRHGMPRRGRSSSSPTSAQWLSQSAQSWQRAAA